ncbi:CBS domain-containing protein [Pseudoalteromonas sp. '520P1 No. 412']|nr:CBS domain-containing protein [Pseudoalteromonas sp. '520P1 No. 412']
MSKNILFCKPETSLFKVANMMGNRNVSAIFIMSDNKLVGVWTEADCAKLDFLEPEFSQQLISSFMSSLVKQVQSSILVSELTVLLHNYGFRHLLAVDENNTPQGVVSLSDVIKSQGLEHYFHFRQVDKSYNAKIPDEYGNSQIVKAIIALAQSLDLEMVAEGVEKEKQLQFLQSIGCHVIQGYFTVKRYLKMNLINLLPIKI